jgi:fumarylacetoacetate (FAA) hydrolase
MSLGPAKGKDFASSFGPYMVTPDEIESARKKDGKLHLQMTCHVNGEKISDGNTNDLYHSFETMIERASMNTKLMPGEYIGSGTVGTGCILELRPENTGGWLNKGDVVTLEIERLGILENKIV